MRCCVVAGAILTKLGRHAWGSGWGQTLLAWVLYFIWKTPEQGAATSITAAVSPELESHSGAAPIRHLVL